MSESQMSDKTFSTFFFSMIALLIVLTLFLIFLAHVNSGEVSDKLEAQRQAGIDQVVAERVAPVGTLNVGEPPEASAATGSSEQAAAEPRSGDAVYQLACGACHTAGVAGAPKLGDQAGWSDRVAKGEDTLYDHAINGFQGEAGMMPAKGGNASLSDEEVRAAVNYMLGEVGHEVAAEAASTEAASTEAASTEAASTEAASTEAADSSISGEAIYQQACFACHTTGVAGAPKLGDAEAWADRLAKGEETLDDHAINGFQGEAGVMPAKGGFAQLSDDEVRAAVDYMLEAVR